MCWGSNSNGQIGERSVSVPTVTFDLMEAALVACLPDLPISQANSLPRS